MRVLRLLSPREGAGAAGRAVFGLRPGMEGPPAHPPELTCPCCLPALGEFSEMTPHEGSSRILAQPGGVLDHVPQIATRIVEEPLVLLHQLERRPVGLAQAPVAD